MAYALVASRSAEAAVDLFPYVWAAFGQAHYHDDARDCTNCAWRLQVLGSGKKMQGLLREGHVCTPYCMKHCRCFQLIAAQCLSQSVQYRVRQMRCACSFPCKYSTIAPRVPWFVWLGVLLRRLRGVRLSTFMRSTGCDVRSWLPLAFWLEHHFVRVVLVH